MMTASIFKSGGLCKSLDMNQIALSLEMMISHRTILASIGKLERIFNHKWPQLIISEQGLEAQGAASVSTHEAHIFSTAFGQAR